MAKQTINIGSGELAGDGESLRSAFDKINDNFDEVYTGDTTTLGSDTSPALGGNLDLSGNDITGVGNLNITGNITANGPNNTINANTITATSLNGDLQGSVFGDDSTILIDGLESTFNLDGTVKGHIIPAEDSKFNLGSPTHKWKTLYLSATTLKLGDLSLRYTNGKLGVQLDKGPGGEYHGSGWWETSWSATGANLPGIDPTKPMVKHQHQTDGDNENWEDALTNAKKGDLMVLSDPLTEEVTLTLTSDVYKEYVAGTTYYYYQNVDQAPPSGNTTYIYTVFYPLDVTDQPGATSDILNSNGDTLIDSTTGTINADALAGNVDSDLLTGGLFNISGDDSTLRSVQQGDSVQFVGGTGITTTSDADGVITITGIDAYTKAEVDSEIATATSSVVIQSGSTQSIDVVAADSTVLVDSVNGTLNATTLTGALPAIDGSNLTGITTAFSNITSTPTTIAGYGITDAFDGAFGSLSGTPTTLAGYGITDAANTGSETTFTANVLFDTGVQEKFATLTGSTGVTAMDCDNGQVFYLTGAAGDITANFTNLGLTAEYGTNVTVIINQGATPYEVTAVQIGGAAQTIEWQGGVAPTGNANGIDSFSFTILNDGGTYVVLGQMVDFT